MYSVAPTNSFPTDVLDRYNQHCDGALLLGSTSKTPYAAGNFYQTSTPPFRLDVMASRPYRRPLVMCFFLLRKPSLIFSLLFMLGERSHRSNGVLVTCMVIETGLQCP